jgi:hypothetical protein
MVPRRHALAGGPNRRNWQMKATRRYRSDRHTWRLVEIALVFTFTLTVMFGLVGAFVGQGHGLLSCTARSIASVSEGCPAR